MSKSQNDQQKLRMELLLSFHEQFAQNQNHHQRLFMQVLTILLSVFIGYGFLFLNLEAHTQGVTTFMFLGFILLAMILLSIAIAIVLNGGLGFRRDQLLVSKIRISAGLLSPTDNTKIFPKSYLPSSKFAKSEWMPNFYYIFFVGLIIIKVFLISSVFLSCTIRSQFYYSFFNSCLIIFLFTYIFTVLFDLREYDRLYKKWKRYKETAQDYIDNPELFNTR